jgi:REP-associated tyrosine transposase
MPQSLAQIYVHIVFSTKDRKPWLRDGDLCDQLYAYMATILRDNVDSPAILINGAEDHVHVLVRLSRKFPVMKIVPRTL